MSVFIRTRLSYLKHTSTIHFKSHNIHHGNEYAPVAAGDSSSLSLSIFDVPRVVSHDREQPQPIVQPRYCGSAEQDQQKRKHRKQRKRLHTLPGSCAR